MSKMEQRNGTDKTRRFTFSPYWLLTIPAAGGTRGQVHRPTKLFQLVAKDG